MSSIKKLVVGETTLSTIRGLFDNRIAQEGGSPTFNNVDRALKIKDLKSQVIGFINRNHNGNFELIVPEYRSEQVVKLKFTNYTEVEDDEDPTYVIEVNDNFVSANITHRVKVGKDIILKIKAE